MCLIFVLKIPKVRIHIVLLKMKIIDIVTEDIGDIKTIVEILNGFIPEANVDFIKDARAYSESFKKKNTTERLTDGTGENAIDNKSKYNNNIKQHQLKGQEIAQNIPEKIIKKQKDKNNEIDEITPKNKKAQLKEKGKKKHKENTDQDDECEEDEMLTNKIKKKKEEKNTIIDSNSNDSDDKEENRGEIKILTADPNQVMITFIVLKGSAFKKFIIHPDKYSVGLNLDELFKYIKNVDKDGTMSIHIDSDDTQHIIFDVKSENATSQESICELRVLNLSSKKDRRIEANVAMAVRINCHAFHTACKDLMQFSQFVEITCDPSQLAITCKGDLSNHKRIFKVDGTQNGIIIKTVKSEDKNDEPPNIIRLVFDLKYINSMYKCKSLCEDMEIYLNTDSVMFLKYGIKIIGEMLVGISPSRKKKEYADKYDENDDDYYQDDEKIQLR